MEAKEKSVNLIDGFLLVAGLRIRMDPLNGDEGPRLNEIKNPSFTWTDFC